MNTTSERVSMRNALTTYGGHLSSCSASRARNAPCSCGWDVTRGRLGGSREVLDDDKVITRLKESVARYYKHLSTYGRHIDGCTMGNGRSRCKCGFLDAVYNAPEVLR